MRPFIPAILAAVALLASLGSTLPNAASAPAVPKARTLPRVPVLPTGLADFPNCPAPAVNGMNIRRVTTADGPALAIFVVVQNVGNRAFFAAPGRVALTVSRNGKPLGSFPLERLAPGEVKFFSVAGTPVGQDEQGDVVASIDFAPTVPTGPVADTLDCQTSDNRAVRKADAVGRAPDRVAQQARAPGADG